jgi:hypothetical protein
MTSVARRHAAPLLCALGYALLILAWALSSPPFAAPDEDAHYLRALTLSQGELLGPPAAAPIPAGASAQRVAQLRWQNLAMRAVPVPPHLNPGGYNCNAGDADVSAACINAIQGSSATTQALDPVGTYPPLAYLLPAAVVRLGGDAPAANRWGRLASAAVCVALLTAAAFLVWDEAAGIVSLAGLLLAITPMVISMAGALNPSGLELTGAAAFAAALVRLARGGAVRWIWVATAVSGLLLALARTTGPAWIVCALAVVALMGGLWEAARARSRSAAWTAGAVVAGIVLNRLWEALWGPATPFGLAPFPHSLVAPLRFTPTLLREEIGTFGYLDTPLPGVVYAAWVALAGALGIAALVVGRARERVAVVAGAGIALLFPVIFQAAIVRHTGFGMQGRYVLPLSIIALVVSGEVLVRHRARLGRAAFPFGVGACLLALLQLVAYLVDARRQAVGLAGPLGFAWHARWSPPAGWWIWIALAAGGAVALAATARYATRGSAGPSSP